MRDRHFQLPIFDTKPRMDVARWAETYRYMPKTSQMFSFTQTPFFRRPAEYMADLASTAAVVIKCPSQTGKTETLLNFLGWMCDYDRENTLLILDTAKNGTRMSKNRIRPFLRETCGINAPNNGQKNPDRSNEITNIGLGSRANLMIGSSKSASDLCSSPIKYLLCDELDRWADDLKGEGDPLQLALQRQMRFRGMAVLTSTPTTKDGRIMQNFMLGTQETWGVICPTCGTHMPCLWKDIDFSGTTPFISCPKCGEVFNELDVKKLDHAYGNPANENPLRDVYQRVWRSFEVPGTLCHAFYTWDYLKGQEIAALSLGESSYQSFVNTRLADVYEPKDELDVSVTDLMRLSIFNYHEQHLPKDVDFVVCGIDTHDSCLYIEIVGVSADRKRYFGVEYSVLVGDPAEGKVWNALTEILSHATYIREDGVKLRIALAFQDSGGHRTNDVYKYALTNNRLMPVKGYVSNKDTGQDPLIRKLTKGRFSSGVKGTCRLLVIGVNAAKDELHQLKIMTAAGDTRLYFPKGHGYDKEYFEGLSSEKRINGKWVAPRKGHTNNEPLDCRVYAMAAAEYYYQNYFSKGRDNLGRVSEGSEKTMKKANKKIENIENKPTVKVRKNSEIVEQAAEQPVEKPAEKPAIVEEPQTVSAEDIPHW